MLHNGSDRIGSSSTTGKELPLEERMELGLYAPRAFFVSWAFGYFYIMPVLYFDKLGRPKKGTNYPVKTSWTKKCLAGVDWQSSVRWISGLLLAWPMLNKCRTCYMLAWCVRSSSMDIWVLRGPECPRCSLPVCKKKKVILAIASEH